MNLGLHRKIWRILDMAVKSPVTSNLNPNAPLFVPYSYRIVEDFSPEWWRLVHTSPAFRDYWLRERQPAAAEEEDLSLPDDLFGTSDAEEFLGIIDADVVSNQKMKAAIIGEQNRLRFANHEPYIKRAEHHGFQKDLVASMKMLDTNIDRLHQKHQSFSYKPQKIMQDIPKKAGAKRIHQPR